MNVNTISQWASSILATRHISSRWQEAVYASLALLNIPVVVNYLGWAAALAYLTVMSFMYLAIMLVVPRFRLIIVLYTSLGLVILTSFVQLSALWELGPIFDSRMDRDSAITTWLSAVAHMQFPYALTTDMNNPISPLPFIPILALPFVLLGNVGYLEIFSYFMLSLLLWHRYHRVPHTLALALFSLSTAPLVFFEVVARSDILFNMAILMAFILCLPKNEKNMTIGRRYVLGLSLGGLIATRLALLPVIALLVIFLARRYSFRSALIILGTAAALFAILVIPFLIWDFQTFTTYAPLGVNATKLGESALSRFGWPLLTALGIVLAAAIAKKSADLFHLQIPILATVVLSTWLTFFFDLSYLQFFYIPLLFSFRPEGSYR